MTNRSKTVLSIPAEPALWKNERFCLFLVWTFVVLHIFSFSAVSLGKYYRFLYFDWDLATHNQIMRNLLHGNTWISLFDMPFLGNHLNFTFFLLLPLYALYPHPESLLVWQSIALGIAAVPLYYLSRRLLNPAWGLFFVAAYLLHPAVGYTNLNEFHPECFLPLLQFLLFYYFLKDDFKRFAFFVLLLILTKENIALLMMTFGIYAWMKRKTWKWILTPFLAGLVWFIAYQKISAIFNMGNLNYYDFYSYLGRNFWEMIWSIVTHPLKILTLMFSHDRIVYLGKLFRPLSFLPLLSPDVLFITLPNFMQHLLSQRLAEYSILFYYPIEILGFLFAGFVFSVKFLSRFKWSKIISVLFCIFLVANVVLAVSFPGSPFNLRRHARKIMAGEQMAVIKKSFVKMIPPNAAIVSTFDFLPFLSDQTAFLYSFNRVLSGYYHMAKKYKLPGNIEYALIDFNDKIMFSCALLPEEQENLLNFFKNNPWSIVAEKNDIVLLKKSAGGNSAYASLVKKLSDKFNMSVSID